MNRWMMFESPWEKIYNCVWLSQLQMEKRRQIFEFALNMTHKRVAVVCHKIATNEKFKEPIYDDCRHWNF